MAPTAHARLSPSSARRWIRCAGSPNLIESLGEPDSAGDAAKEGSILHQIAEECLRDNLDPYDFVGEERTFEGYTYEVTEDDAKGILDALDRIDELPGRLLIEKRVDLDRWMPGQFGTSDVTVIGKWELVVGDHKFGYIPVSPVENDQLRLYALGVYDNFVRGRHPDPETIRLIIWQPRAWWRW